MMVTSFEEGETMDDGIKSYRDGLVTDFQKAQDDFDKTVLMLSSGALGITISFIKDIVGNKPIVYPWLIFLAWCFWGLSVLAVLLSYYFSHLAFGKALKQFDHGKTYKERLGGWFDFATRVCNWLDGVCFVIGMVLAIAFTNLNL